MNRREFTFLLASAIALRPNLLPAQQGGRIFKIGHLESSTPSNSPHLLGAFRDRLRELGYVEGQNLFIERRYAEGKEERLPQLAVELVKYGVDVIFAIGPPQALAAARATDKIPIVFVGGGDPVALGLVKSFAHPGGNVTGITFVNNLELEAATKNADVLGLTVMPFEVHAVNEFEGAFAAMEREHIDATLILSNPLTFPNRVEMTASALRHHVPTMVSLREYVEAGALMSYGPSYAGHCRRAADYVDQILKGAKPADLPVQLPTEFELTVNSKTAKALGLSIPSSFVLSANIVE
jgi:putative tryptophan/tyrosine transport system substrate-binding protein